MVFLHYSNVFLFHEIFTLQYFETVYQLINRLIEDRYFFSKLEIEYKFEMNYQNYVHLNG